MQKMADFNSTRAVVCGVPASLPGAALRLGEPGEPIDLERARKQHDEYVKVSHSAIINFVYHNIPPPNWF